MESPNKPNEAPPPQRKRFDPLWLVGAALVLLAGVLAVHAWMSRYAFEEIDFAGKPHTVRVDRLTGEMMMMSEFGWLRITPRSTNSKPATPTPSPKPLSQEPKSATLPPFDESASPLEIDPEIEALFD